MYNIQTVSERIKIDARQQGIKLKGMLESCGLNVNFISQMSDRTGAFALAKIADYLNCSVDYLLGRTDNPSITSSAFLKYMCIFVYIKSKNAHACKVFYVSKSPDLLQSGD